MAVYGLDALPLFAMNYAVIDSRDQQGSDKELLRAVLELLRCHLICFLVVWLALFAPMYCQYHGLMMNFGDKNYHDSMAAMQPDAGLHFHQMASSITMVMSLFVAAMPNTLLLLSPSHIRWVRVAPSQKPTEPSLPAPDQPPRWPS